LIYVWIQLCRIVFECIITKIDIAKGELIKKKN
jgi:hypothetical protein